MSSAVRRLVLGNAVDLLQVLPQPLCNSFLKEFRQEWQITDWSVITQLCRIHVFFFNSGSTTACLKLCGYCLLSNDLLKSRVMNGASKLLNTAYH